MSDKGMEVSTPSGAALGSIWMVDWSINAYTMTQSGDVEDSITTRMLSHNGLGVDSDNSIWIGNYASIGNRSSDGEVREYNNSGYSVGGFLPGDRIIDGVDVDSNDSLWFATGGSFYKFDDSGSSLTSVNSPVSNGTEGGLGIDNNDSLLVKGYGDSVYRVDLSGSVTDSLTVPNSDDGEGLGVDSNHCIWLSIGTGQNSSIYRIDLGGDIEEQLDSPGREPEGIGIDTNDSIVVSDLIPRAYNVNIEAGYSSPYPVASVDLPGAAPYGLGVDTDGYVWTANDNISAGGPVYIYGQNLDGSIVYQLGTGYANAEAGNLGVDIDSNNCIWFGQNNFGSPAIVQLDRGGNYVSGFGAESNGIGIDSSDCIWFIEGGFSPGSIYKVDQYGIYEDGFSITVLDGSGLAVDPQGSLWASSYQYYQMYKLDQNGSVLQQLNGVGAFTKGIGYV